MGCWVVRAVPVMRKQDGGGVLRDHQFSIQRAQDCLSLNRFRCVGVGPDNNLIGKKTTFSHLLVLSIQISSFWGTMIYPITFTSSIPMALYFT